MDFDKIKQDILNSSETSTSESESISGSELHEEFEINNFLPEFEPLKLSGKNLAQQYVSAFNTGMNIYQCLNYLQGYVYTLVTATNETIEAWNTVVPLLEQATKEWTDEEFNYKWSILKPQVIELVTNLTIETFNKAWEDLKPVVIKLAQDTTDAEFKKQWDILKPQVITLVGETTTNKFNEEWEKLKPTIIQLSTDTTIAQFNKSWEELKPKVIELSQTTTSNKFDEKWEELRPQVIELAQTTTSNKFDEKWEALQPTLTETVNNLAKTQTTTTFNYKWSILKPQVIELVTNLTIETFNKAWEDLKPVVIKLAQDTTDAEFKKQWDILKPQVITLVGETTTNKFNEEWEKLKPTIIQLSTDTTIAQFNKSWEELKPKVIELSQTTTSNKFDEKWEELRPQVIELAQTTTSNKFDEKWEALQPTLTETVNNLAKTQTTTTFNEKWEELKPQVIELAQTTTGTKFDEKWTELQPTLNTTLENLVNTNLETFKSTLWQEVTKNNDFPFLLPENFGAVGDGTTDDSRAFTECFTSANENHKYILLSNKTYLIGSTLTNIYNTNIIGINTTIILGNNTFTKQVYNCVFSNITFARAVKSDLPLTEVFISSQFKYCNFIDINYLFKYIDNSNDTQGEPLCILNNCSLSNTNIIKCDINNSNHNNFIINNTLLYYDDTASNTSFIVNGYFNCKYIFNNCFFERGFKDNVFELFNTVDDFEFNTCNIINKHNASMFLLSNISNVEKQQIIFNNCNILNENKYLIDVAPTNNTVLPTVNIKYSTLKVNAIFNAKNECSLWLENNQIDTKPVINAGAGKVNLVEIQQKYSPESENIFPWTTEPTPTVENNVSLNKIGTDQYYILTESKDKNIKKLDYYFKYDVNYLPSAPYYSNNIFVRDLDLEGYTVKKSYLSNNICKLKDKSTGELIDYVYLMLDDNVTVETIKDDPKSVYTTIAIKYLPYFAKLKTDTPVGGQCYVDACISIILEKTSS